MMTEGSTVRLLELEPDLARFMTADDAEVVDGLAVPAIEVAAGDLDVSAMLAGHSAFGLVLLDGMLVRRIVVSQTATLRLLGPGDLVSVPPAAGSMLVAGSGWRAAAPTRMALLGREVLLAVHRAPRLMAGFHVRSTEQAERVALQLAICQLPRVEDRVLSLLWLLAESWGQVTVQGTALRLHLTHETLGGLVGARRSTVTLALGQLDRRGGDPAPRARLAAARAASCRRPARGRRARPGAARSTRAGRSRTAAERGPGGQGRRRRRTAEGAARDHRAAARDPRRGSPAAGPRSRAPDGDPAPQHRAARAGSHPSRPQRLSPRAAPS